MSGTRISNLLKKVTVLVFICYLTLPAQGKYGGGTGEPNDPYQIADANALLELAADTNDYGKCFLMTADVNMQGQSFTDAIIAPHTGGYSEPFQGKAFTGTFDGNGHKITSFNISGLKNWYIGLFGQIDSGGTVRNLGLENFAVNGARYIGCLVGNNVNGSIRNCYSIGQISGSSQSRYIGGLVGYNSGSISNCQSSYQSITYQKVALSNSTDYISGYFSAGGLVGVNSGSISDCWSTASVGGSGGSSAFGGFAGINSGNITSCYSTGTSVGESSVGGFVGSNSGNIINCHSTGQVNGYYLLIGGFAGKNIGSITKCYSTGSVIVSSISQYIGGLVGDNDSGGSISNCFATGVVNDSYNGKYVGGLVGGNYNSSINNCYSTSTVKGNNYIGGLVGRTWYGSNISNCFSMGQISGSTNVGGLIGVTENDSNTTNSFWDIDTSGWKTSDGGTGLPTAKMKTKSTFTDAGWDFINVWNIGENQTYPYLRKYSPANLNKDHKVDFLDIKILCEQWLQE